MTTEGGKYIEVEADVKLFIQDVGSGDPIFFIPGWTFTTEVFSEQIAHFSKIEKSDEALDGNIHQKP
jgi:non-heme chloroperoxidase